ncbi:MAG: flagellar biosynthetic protein FliR [Selenomonadaceae bacterium]
MDLYDIMQNHAGLFLLVLTRVSGIFLLAPFFGSLNIPVYIRAGTAFAIAMVLFPVIDQQGIPQIPQSVVGYMLAVIVELIVGWLIGFVAYITFAAIHMAGKLLDMQVGFAVVNVVDPTSGQQIPLLGSFLYNLGIIIFLVTNGHHMVISGLFESFQMIPVLGATFDLSISDLMVDLTGGIFVTGMKIALPVLFAILLTDVGLGVLARTMPQMNIFVVGIPAKIVIGLFVLSIALPFYILFLDVMFNEMYGNISAALRAIR